MAQKTCQAAVVSCIDFRFQSYIDNWLNQNFQQGTFDRVALAGGVKNLPIILNQIDISHKLHQIKKVILINHQDCGAYGKSGTEKKHSEDLKKAADKINAKFPEIEVEACYLQLSGEFKKINNLNT